MTKELKFAVDLARGAGDILLAEFQKPFIKKFKEGGIDVVSEADLKSEEFIIQQIKKHYPPHRIISEEIGVVNGSDDYVWIIDPLDGTKFYTNGVKLFSVSVALWRRNIPLIGVVYQPFLHDMYWAEKGEGAFFNDKKINVSKTDSLKKSRIIINTSPSEKLDFQAREKTAKWLILIYNNFHRLHAVGISSLSCCWVAQGLMTAYFDLIGEEKIWDVAAGLVIAQEAGATISGLDGKFHGQEVSNIVVTNSLIHNDFLKLLRSV